MLSTGLSDQPNNTKKAFAIEMPNSDHQTNDIDPNRTAPRHIINDKIEKGYAISLSSIKDALTRIRDFVHCTPIYTCSSISKLVHPEAVIFFKCENFQKAGSFKIRGATNAIKRVGSISRIVTHSSGNHAQAIALAAKQLGVDATIVMPNNVKDIKRLATIGYGAQVVLCEPTNAAREETADKIVQETKGCFIHPSDDKDVMAGQGTVGLEILQQLAEIGKSVDAIIVPVGGGGLLSGVAMAVKSEHPNIQIIGAEPANASDAHASMAAGHIVGHAMPPDTVADGLKTMLGSNNWPVIRDLVDEIILVSETQIIDAMRLVWERSKLLIEASSAVAVAAAISEPFKAKGIHRICVVLTGGNVDLNDIPWITHPTIKG